jgi:hypothetical protein
MAQYTESPNFVALNLSESFYCLSDYLERQFQLSIISSGQSLAEKKFAIEISDPDEVGRLFTGWLSYRSGRTLTLLSPNHLVSTRISHIDRIADIEVRGVEKEIEKAVSLISGTYVPVPVRVKWFYNAKGESVRLPIRSDQLPETTFYPALKGRELSDYYDTYLASDSNVLILLGPPGTGKTSFLRGLLHHAQSDALISYDPDILRDDEIFANFMSGQERFMILEDADTFLASRTKSGNTVMHKFLNVGDGLLSTKGKKIVFTTNLPSIRDIDDALMRPGRCFDVLRFAKLTPDEARAIRPEYGGTEAISLAELLNGGPNPSVQKDPVGFI